MSLKRRTNPKKAKGKSSGPHEQVVDASIMGVRPLLQNAMTDGDSNQAAKRGQVYDDKEEAEKRLITNGKGELCQPAIHLESSMIRAAVEFKFKGQKTYKDLFKAAVFVEPLMVPHKDEGWVIDKQYVVIGKARILRCRPRFDSWALDFTVRILDDRVQPLIVQQVLETAGKYYGIGDYRPRFGLFEVTEFEVR